MQHAVNHDGRMVSAHGTLLVSLSGFPCRAGQWNGIFQDGRATVWHGPRVRGPVNCQPVITSTFCHLRSSGFLGGFKLRLLWLAIVSVSVAALAQNQPAARSKFEVASIKECKSTDRPPPVDSSPGRMSTGCWPLSRVVSQAYDLYASGKVDPNKSPGAPLPVEGGPDWMQSARFTIDAKAENPVGAAMMPRADDADLARVAGRHQDRVSEEWRCQRAGKLKLKAKKYEADSFVTKVREALPARKPILPFIF